jgi:membrane carboxypeptidase/penicillin-binding protein
MRSVPFCTASTRRTAVRYSRAAADVPRPRSQRRAAPVTTAVGASKVTPVDLRGVVRLPSGTAAALTGALSRVAVIGKTRTSNDFRDARFGGSTYGVDGMTAAVRIGFDDHRSLGSCETAAASRCRSSRI